MPTGQHTIVIRIAEDNPAEANLAAQRLSEFIQAEASAVEGTAPTITPHKERSDTQDLGSMLVLAFGTPFAIAIAKGIAAYIGALGSRVVIETPDGKIIASGDGAKNIDVAKTVTAFVARKPAAATTSPPAVAKSTPQGGASKPKPARKPAKK